MNSPSPKPAEGSGAVVRRLEVAAWCAGGLLVSIFVVSRLDATLGRRAALADFEKARAGVAASLAEFEAPDKSLWSPERVRGFQASLEQDFHAPLAVLRVPKIGLVVPVLEGTDEAALNRGVGHIRGTPRPGEPGNIGIAGHRDGFFRGLKDISPGDEIVVETVAGPNRYSIESLSIVTPERVDVLAPTTGPVLTLVTCYPFYFVGSAPQRFIVRAKLIDTGESRMAERRIRAP